MKKNLSNSIENNRANLAYQYLKDKSNAVEKSAHKRIQKHPLQSIGLALFSGFVLAKIIF